MTTKILVVCLGNICRSPTAHAVLRDLAASKGLSISVDSAGTSGFHNEEPPDLRARETAEAYGHDMSDIRSRQVHKSDFTNFDQILAMDANTLFKLQAIAPPNATATLATYLGAAGGQGDVEDPYYSGNFDAVFNVIKTAAEHIVSKNAKP